MLENNPSVCRACGAATLPHTRTAKRASTGHVHSIVTHHHSRKSLQPLSQSNWFSKALARGAILPLIDIRRALATPCLYVDYSFVRPQDIIATTSLAFSLCAECVSRRALARRRTRSRSVSLMPLMRPLCRRSCSRSDNP